MAEAVEKSIEEKKKEPGWWSTLDIKAKIGVAVIGVIIFYIYILKGQNIQNAIFMGGLVLLVVIALSSKHEPEKNVLSPREAIETAKMEAMRLIKEDEMFKDCRIYFNGKCSDLIQMSGVPTSYYMGFNFHYADGYIEYTRAIVSATQPNIGGTTFQKLDEEFNGIEDVVPHKEWILPSRWEAAKARKVEWIFK